MASSTRRRFAPLLSRPTSSTPPPGPDHPPGYYGPSGAARAFNLVTAKTTLKPLRTIEGASEVSGYTLRKPIALEPWLYLAALAPVCRRRSRHAAAELGLEMAP